MYPIPVDAVATAVRDVVPPPAIEPVDGFSVNSR
jgi:hypothetical protein